MESRGLAMKLKPDCYPEYKRRHDELWPELAELLKKNQVSMVIYRFNDYLFVHQTAPSEDVWARVAEHPVTARWNTYMSEVLETDEDGDIRFHSLALAFAIGDFR